MKNKLSALLPFSLFIMLLSWASCSHAKKTTKQAVTPRQEPVAFSLDTIGTKYRIAPKPGHTLMIENLQVHLTSNTQPGVGVIITRADSSRSNLVLPYIVNTNVYSYGGNIHFTLKSGDVAIVDVADIMTGKPIQARFIVSGTEQKN
ncbi:MAG: hypothetical protein J0M07_07070 [Anaerolineae bacterium]|jgi:hypothetical protein|nr:hypothetical protein [Anaerolineae bacterium]MBN8669142.1 hypothetical protein [Chitinophagales bacterium]